MSSPAGWATVFPAQQPPTPRNNPGKLARDVTSGINRAAPCGRQGALCGAPLRVRLLQVVYCDIYPSRSLRSTGAKRQNGQILVKFRRIKTKGTLQNVFIQASHMRRIYHKVYVSFLVIVL